MGVTEFIRDIQLDWWEWLANFFKEPVQIPFTPQGGGGGKGHGDSNEPHPPHEIPNIDDEDFILAQRQIRKIARRLATSMSRSRKRTKKHHEVDFRKTMRKSISTGGIICEIKWKTKEIKKPRIVAILDSSGSMDEHVKLLIQILQAIKLELSNFELFIFSDGLSYVTDSVSKDWKETIANISKDRNWNGGTNFYQSMGELLYNYNNVLHPKSIVLLLSDLESYSINASIPFIKQIAQKVKRFYVFNTIDSIDFNDEWYQANYYQPIEQVVDKIFAASSLDEMAQAVKNVCLK